MSMNPHIYKKGKALCFKKLDTGNNEEVAHVFSGSKPATLTTLTNLGNNLNQLTGRCLLGIYKLLSYFGLSKDPSAQFSKTPGIHGAFFTFFQKGEGRALGDLKDIKNLLTTHSARLERIEDKINHLNPYRNDVPITRNEVVDFTTKLNEIEEYLRKIIG